MLTLVVRTGRLEPSSWVVVEKIPVTIVWCRFSISREMRVTDMLKIINLGLVRVYRISHSPASECRKTASEPNLANRQETVKGARLYAH